MAIASRTFPRLRAKPYDRARPLIESGDLLMCSGSGVFSKMIRGATKSVWSHVGLLVRVEGIDRVMVFESVEPVGVRAVPLSHYVRDYRGEGKGYFGKILVARHAGLDSTSAPLIQRLSRFAIDRFGYPYDKDEIARIAARIGRAAFGLKARDVKRDKEFICSEFVWECYDAVRLPIAYDERGFIAPADFAKDPDVSAVAEISVQR